VGHFLIHFRQLVGRCEAARHLKVKWSPGLHDQEGILLTCPLFLCRAYNRRFPVNNQ
jgi:hypothetical protein